MAKELPLVRDFVILPETITVAQARERERKGSYAVIVDSQGTPCGCLYELTWTTKWWPSEQTLAAMKVHWQVPTLPEAEAIDLLEVARFFRDVWDSAVDAAGVVLLDQEGRPSAVLPRGKLQAELQTKRGADPVSKGLEETVSTGQDTLMANRYGHLQFPRQAPLRQPCELKVAINREEIPGAEGEVKLELTAGSWPLRVRVSLVNLRPEDFLVVGPSTGVIEVPRIGDTAPLIFTLVAQSLGSKTIRVRFEQFEPQDVMYLNTAKVSTEVVDQPLTSGHAEVEEMPTLTGRPVGSDITIYVEKVEGLVYTMRVVKPGEQVSREIDTIEFPYSPETYLDAIFADLNAKTQAGLSPSDYDEEVKKIGENLYVGLFHDDGFKKFYWEEMANNPEAKTVIIVSDEPYIPWEILRPTRELDNGKWETDELYFCERFALARWLSGPSPVTQLYLLSVALVVPPSNLQYVTKEVTDIKGLLSPVVPEIGDMAALENLLQNGQADVLHFACHGRYDAELPERSELVLGSRRFTPWDLVGENRNFVSTQPLVFLNACDSGREGMGLTGLDGWASAFLQAGPSDPEADGGKPPSRSYAGAFLGSVWRTTDERACVFATEFYRGLLEGQMIGEAMRLARAKVKQEGDATYLSYTLYANPRARAVRPVR